MWLLGCISKIDRGPRPAGEFGSLDAEVFRVRRVSYRDDSTSIELRRQFPGESNATRQTRSQAVSAPLRGS